VNLIKFLINSIEKKKKRRGGEREREIELYLIFNKNINYPVKT